MRSPSSSQVQDTGLSRRQQGFESPWGRQGNSKESTVSVGSFFFAGRPDFFPANSSLCLLGRLPEGVGHVIRDGLDIFRWQIKCGHGPVPVLHRGGDELVNILPLPELRCGEIRRRRGKCSPCRPFAGTFLAMAHHAFMPVEFLPLVVWICGHRSLRNNCRPNAQNKQQEFSHELFLLFMPRHCRPQ